MSTAVEVLRPREPWQPPAATLLDEGRWQAWVAKGRAEDRRNCVARMKALKWVAIAALLCAAGFFLTGVLSAAPIPGDLSRYRDFQLGTNLAAVVGKAGANPEQVKEIHRRPALMQELAWRPQPFGGPAPQKDPAKEVVFGFYNGELFRIAIDYDRYETEGMTADDVVNAISSTYGAATKPAAAVAAGQVYGEQEEILAQWQDSQYRYDLMRSSYGPAFKLVAAHKRLEALAAAATLEAARLDDQEAPQRDAARLASEEEATKNKLARARLVNRPKFRP
jgi:hypothetical protein